MHRLYEKAMLWEMVDLERNPMQLVEVKGISKRRKKPLILTVDQYHCILSLLPQPYHTMVVVAQCLGLRAEEILALHWSDIDFNRRVVRVSRAVVHGRTKTVKTEYSEDELPLDPDFAGILLDWKIRAPESELVFPSHITGRPFHASPDSTGLHPPCGMLLGRLYKVLGGGWRLVSARNRETCSPAPGALACSRKLRAGRVAHVRHAHRSWLDATGAPMGVQQKLMRHAQISTTMNVYGNALMDSKREANSRVARMALKIA